MQATAAAPAAKKVVPEVVEQASQAVPAAPAANPDRKVEPMTLARIKSGEFIRTVYVATAHLGTRPQDLLKPEYWAHVAAIFKPRDRVEVWADNGSWMADVVVMGSGRNHADVRILTVHSVDAAPSPGDTPDVLKAYEVIHRGVHSQWSVIRKADSAVVFEGGTSRQVADTWLANHLKAFN